MKWVPIWATAFALIAGGALAAAQNARTAAVTRTATGNMPSAMPVSPVVPGA
jgi:hypothetical protein